MAREQQLSLNPGKISGACGRLMCCLSYELTQYRDSAEGLPPWAPCCAPAGPR
jgi:cell fate regulator YaaT (PSP1 superfamily)